MPKPSDSQAWIKGTRAGSPPQAIDSHTLSLGAHVRRQREQQERMVFPRDSPDLQ